MATRQGGIRRYSAVELAASRARGESLTDLPSVRAKSEAELDRDIAEDPDFRDVPHNWFEAAEAVMPVAKRLLSLRLDSEVVDWFEAKGPGYQTRINALKAFVRAAEKGHGESLDK